MFLVIRFHQGGRYRLLQEENPSGQIMHVDGNYSGALIHHQSLLRNKRCLLSYLYVSSHSSQFSAMVQLKLGILQQRLQ